MFKSIISKLVAVSASAVLASAIIASSASALNIANKPVQRPCVPQIALTSDGQVHGTCFGATGTVWLEYWDQRPNSDGGFEVIVAADGTFTQPITMLESSGALNNHLCIVAQQYPGPYNSNELVVSYGHLYQPVPAF